MERTSTNLCCCFAPAERTQLGSWARQWSEGSPRWLLSRPLVGAPLFVNRPGQALVLELLLEPVPHELVSLALPVGLEDGAVIHDLGQHRQRAHPAVRRCPTRDPLRAALAKFDAEPKLTPEPTAAEDAARGPRRQTGAARAKLTHPGPPSGEALPPPPGHQRSGRQRRAGVWRHRRSPMHFVEDTPTDRLVRQVLGAVVEFEKTTLVAKLAAARTRKRMAIGEKVEGARAMSRRARTLWRWQSGSPARNRRAGALSLRAISASLAEQGHLNERGKPFNPKSVAVMLAARAQ